MIHITSTRSFSATKYVEARPSVSSVFMAKSANGRSDTSLRTAVNDADGSGRASVTTVRTTPLKNTVENAADGADANWSGPSLNSS